MNDATLNQNTYTSLFERHPSLKPFSRDHGVGLVCVQRLKKAVSSSRQERIDLSSQMISVCHEILTSYLNDEHRLLSALVPPELIAEYNHRYILLCVALERFLLHEPGGEPGTDILRRLSSELSDYIQWEERTLFPAIEYTVPEEELARLQAKTEPMDLTHTRPTKLMHSSVQGTVPLNADVCEGPLLDPEL